MARNRLVQRTTPPHLLIAPKMGRTVTKLMLQGQNTLLRSSEGGARSMRVFQILRELIPYSDQKRDTASFMNEGDPICTIFARKGTKVRRVISALEFRAHEADAMGINSHWGVWGVRLRERIHDKIRFGFVRMSSAVELVGRVVKTALDQTDER
ncbi:hypothetical protein CASFOL_034943 [Castilleja foliolosa]|uniref:Uncharacterized protein n=1 Tax=Castilleja foliolosa TaxID=1961234 RepID=A0ABD3BR98_9LAMI